MTAGAHLGGGRHLGEHHAAPSAAHRHICHGAVHAAPLDEGDRIVRMSKAVMLLFGVAIAFAIPLSAGLGIVAFGYGWGNHSLPGVAALVTGGAICAVWAYAFAAGFVAKFHH